jgi:hypothetical protein
MRQHLTHRRSLGFRYEREQARLLNFDRYLQRRPEADRLPVHVLVREYAEGATTPEARLERWQSGRTLARGMQRHDPTVTFLLWAASLCGRRSVNGDHRTFILSRKCSACSRRPDVSLRTPLTAHTSSRS